MKTWTQEEVNILKDNYNKAINDELIKLLPGKSAIAIYKKAYSIGLRKTKEAEHANRSASRRMDKNSNWKGGMCKTKAGYKQILVPGHPRADKHGYVMEHIVVWENATGIQVPINCCIHHLNGDKMDNRIQNLCLMERGAHTIFHHSGSKLSDESKSIISQKAKERFSDKRNHPFYKDIDATELLKLRNQGMKVSDICTKYGISKRTYYDKLKDVEKENA